MKVDEVTYNQARIIAEILNPQTIQETCPVLLVGGAVAVFKHTYKGTINELKNTEDVKEFVMGYTGIKSSKPVVISDIGYLKSNASFLLLKLVEESSFPVILLSTIDKVDSILLSRIKRIVKFPKDVNSGNTFMPMADAYDYVYGEDKSEDTNKRKLTVSEKMTFYAENCPSLYEIEMKVPYGKNRNSIIEILGNCIDTK